MYARVGTRYEVGLINLGEALLKECFHTALYAVRPVSSMPLASHTFDLEAVPQSVAFLKGSGLEMVIETFGLSLDPDVLRETFFRWSHWPPSSP